MRHSSFFSSPFSPKGRGAFRGIAVVLASLLVAAPTVRPGDPRPGATPPALTALLDEQTFAVVRIDFAQVFGGDLLTRLAESAGVPADELSGYRQQAERAAAAFAKAGGKEVYVVASMADAPELLFFVVPLGPGADEKALGGLFGEARFFPNQQVAKVGGSLVCAAPKALARLRTLRPAAPAELAHSDPFAKPAALEALLLISPDNRRVFEELLPELPPDLGGGSVKVITRGLRWVRLSGEAAPTGLRLILQGRDAGSAKELHGLVQHALRFLAGQKEVTRILPHFDKQKELLLPRVDGDKLVLDLKGSDLFGIVEPTMRNARRAALQTKGANNLKQIGLALYNYYDTHKTFPTPASYDTGGRPLLSWRVHLLPYLEHQALYKEFRLDEPWDSEHNKKLIPRMPAVYRGTLSKVDKAGKTVYLAPLGNDTMFPGTTGVRINDVTDGTSNTIFVVEADDANAVEWTRPADLKIDPKYPGMALERGHPGGFLLLFVDGSVHLVPVTIRPDSLWALFTRNGGEAVQW
jgi:hypothetical protein